MSHNLEFHFFKLTIGRIVWRIAAHSSLEKWARQFARILELEDWQEPAEGALGLETRHLFLLPHRNGSRREPSLDVFPSGEGGLLPLSGWIPTPLHHLLWWRHSQAPTGIIEVPVGGGEDMQVLDMSRACFAFYTRLIETGGFPLHAALVVRPGSAVALAGSGGTGKSTCSRRIPHPWQAVSDDLMLIAEMGVEQGAYVSHPFPTWSDYFWNRSQGTWPAASSRPLRGVFFLSQASQDRVIPMGQGEAAINLSGSAHQILSNLLWSLPQPEQRALRLQVFDNACRLARSLPAYLLEVSQSGEFWREMEKVL